MAGIDAVLATQNIRRTDATADLQAQTKNLGQRSLGQQDFLALMTAQLKNQDPFDPVDNTQMVAQMAQFSSLAGITEMSVTLKAIADRLGASGPSDALGWVGRTVLVEGSTALPRDDGSVAGAIELDGDAASVAVTIVDAAGNVVREVALGPQGKGTVDYAWDGTREDGSAAGPGPYNVRVAATGKGGGTVAARNLVWAPVTSVTLAGDDPLLTLPGIGPVKSSAVRQVG